MNKANTYKKLPEKYHQICNICYHLGWSECSMKSDNVVAYVGHIIERNQVDILCNHIGYCSECDSDNEDLTTIFKKKVVSIDTICNARLNLCEEHINQLKEQNSIS